jgi:arylsulfatase A-like enzyme
LVEVLRKQQCWNNAVLVVTADHGEEFLEQGNRYHSPVGLPEQLIRVPLLIRNPETTSGRTIKGPFSLIHLTPTLLEALEVNVPSSFQGSPCWKKVAQGGELQDTPAIVECVDGCNNPWSVDERMRPRLLAIRDCEYKLVVRFKDQADELYHLKEDPFEHNPLPSGIEKQARTRLWQFANEHLCRARGRRDSSRALRARLREIRRELNRRVDRQSAQSDTLEIAGHG